MTDTSREAATILIAIYRRMTPGEKWLRLGQIYREARLLHAAGLRLRNRSTRPGDAVADWLRVQFGVRLIAREEPTMDSDNLGGLRAVTHVLKSINIPYALGGSMAGALYA